MLYLLFLLSGFSGLVYQVIWVRGFGNAFGNTIHSASLVIAIFMLGLGAGSYAVGVWSDRRYQHAPDSLLRAYGLIELLIAALGLGVSLALPFLDPVVAGLSAYTTGADGWHALTTMSYVARAMVAVVLLGPITVLMGGTLTLLIRYVVRGELTTAGWRVAALYTVNTVGAAAGAFATDFALAPVIGLRGTQLIAVGMNVVAGLGALLLARRLTPAVAGPRAVSGPSGGRRTAARQSEERTIAGVPVTEAATSSTVLWISSALALSGFAAMGFEILWLRHVNLLLGGFRAVFSLMMTVLLVALGTGALLGGWIDRRTRRPADAFMVAQALFLVAALYGIGSADAATLSARGQALSDTVAALSPSLQRLAEIWFNLRPMLLEVGLPSLLAGMSFPLANAVVQRVDEAVGRRAGILYFANTVGAVAGSLLAGYLLLPRLGIQASTAFLACASVGSILALFGASRSRRPFLIAGALSVAALALWFTLPSDYVLRRAIVAQAQGEQLVSVSEGATELIEVVEAPGQGRGLLTNGHAMSSTAPLDQRYMRALAHIPLLSMTNPERVLVIGFGVGNSTHAATLHPSVRQVDVADLSRHVLDQAPYFRDANHDVLKDPRVSVFVNDGRQHLQMMPPASYDLITLEPPPIAHAGVAALYSTEFYRLARSRLKPGGYVSQWLPAYQVPGASSLAMVRAFVDVFPRSVLLSGMQAELLLLGTTADEIDIDPVRLARSLQQESAVRADLSRLDLGTPREIVGTFVGSATTLTNATRQSPAVTDDRPLQEYGVLSNLATNRLGVPASLFDLGAVGTWCPRCFDGDQAAPEVAGLDVYLALMEQAYATPPAEVEANARTNRGRTVMGSSYLGAALPDTPAVRDLLESGYRTQYAEGEALLEARRFPEAVAAFRAALLLTPDSAAAHNNLGVSLASMGELGEAADHFRSAVALQPDFAEARRNLAQAVPR